MGTLPALKTDRVHEPQRRRLALWLHEWTVEIALRGAEPYAGAASARCEATGFPAATLVAPTDAEPPPVSGQIRLMHPALQSPASMPLYIALLAKEAGGIFLAAPFSRFSEPATDGELLTGRGRASLRVLSVWNARRLPSDLAAQSWVVDTLRKQELANALALHSHLAEGDALPASVARLAGAPLRHPLDPRRDYVRIETAIMDVLVRGRGMGLHKLPIAAESHAEYGTRKRSRRTGRKAAPPSDRPKRG